MSFVVMKQNPYYDDNTVQPYIYIYIKRMCTLLWLQNKQWLYNGVPTDRVSVALEILVEQSDNTLFFFCIFFNSFLKYCHRLFDNRSKCFQRSCLLSFNKLLIFYSTLIFVAFFFIICLWYIWFHLCQNRTFNSLIQSSNRWTYWIVQSCVCVQ